MLEMWEDMKLIYIKIKPPKNYIDSNKKICNLTDRTGEVSNINTKLLGYTKIRTKTYTRNSQYV